MFRSALAIWLGLMALLAAAPPARAAGGCPGKIIFSDNFETLDPAWGTPSAVASTSLEMLMLRPGAGMLIGRFNLAHRVKDFALCARAGLASAARISDPGGIAFWATSAADYWLFAIDVQGGFAVYHTVGGHAGAVVKWQATKALKPGVGVWNALKVTAIGDQVTMAINGQEVARVTGTPPASGGYVGFIADADKTGPAEWAFSRLTVTDGGAAPPAAPQAVAVAPQAVAPQAAAPQAVASAGGGVYWADGSAAIGAGFNKGGKIALGKTQCALPGARLISVAIDGQGRIFAGTADGRVLVCPQAGAPDDAFRAGDAGAPAGDTYVALGAKGDLWVLIDGQSWLAGSPPPEIAHYAAAGAGGAPALLGVIKGPASGFSNPQGLAVDGEGRVLVLDQRGVAGRILIFGPGASGNEAPEAMIGNASGIVGDKTALVDPAAIGVDGAGRIYVGNGGTDVSGRYDARTSSVTVFAADAVGNSAPLALIAGPATKLSGPAGIAVDGKGDIWVGAAIVTQSGAGVMTQQRNGIAVFAAGSKGNAAPIGTYLTGGYAPSVAVYPAGAIGVLAPMAAN